MFTRFPLYLDKYIYLNILTTDDKHIISMAMEGFKSYLNSVKDKTNTFFFPFFSFCLQSHGMNTFCLLVLLFSC